MKLYSRTNQKLKDLKKRIFGLRLIRTYPLTMGIVHYLLFCFTIFSLFRLRLFIERYDDIRNLSMHQYLQIFWMGIKLDGVVIGYTSVLLVIFLMLFPKRWESFHRRFIIIYTSIFYLAFLTSEICGIYFFRYFDFRPNYLVLDHWKDFQLVETAIEAYPVPFATIITISLFAGVFFQQTYFSPLCHRPKKGDESGVLRSGWRDRLALFLVFLFCGLIQRGTLDHRPLNPAASAITKNRVANEIASSGVYKVVYEGIQRMSTKYIPVKSVISTVKNDRAFEIVRENFASRGTLTDDSSNPLVTHVFTGEPQKNMNVVLIVMESMMAKLIGTLGGKPAASPEFDRIAEESVLLQNCYATGERTIQGLEAVICSYPPLPGVGIVRRPQAREGFTTLASVLKERGYQTMFFYGGQGIFDHKRAFFVENGYDTFLEEKDFENPIYRSPWGASDEDLYLRADKVFTELAEKDQPFFGTILTSSLHSPWVYPEGRIEPFPKDIERPKGFVYEEINNFKYADWALGEFFRKIKKSNYVDNTIFVVVGDHGVHLRGKELIPVEEYRIGALIYAPQILKPDRITESTSQLDIAPTILGFLGGSYRTTFFGRNLFKEGEKVKYAMMVYDKKRYGIISGQTFTILSEKGNNYSYLRDAESEGWIESPYTEEHKENADYCAATLQVAEKILQKKQYHTKMDKTAPF